MFVVLDVRPRRLVHWNVTEHPTAEWTVQQFRACVTRDTTHRFVVHDHDTIYSTAVDRALSAMGLHVFKTPVAAPQANAYCERLIGTARRECLDWMIPLDERHLRRVLAEWVPHYNRGRPHPHSARLCPTPPRAVQHPCQVTSSPAHVVSRRDRFWVVFTTSTRSKPSRREFLRITGLHHEYGLEPIAA